MATSIYVGNLSWSATQEGVESLFSSFGNVHSVNLISDRETGRARGFGFVEMDEADAINAISALDGKEVDGRNLRVNKAEPKKPAAADGIERLDDLIARVAGVGKGVAPRRNTLGGILQNRHRKHKQAADAD